MLKSANADGQVQVIAEFPGTLVALLCCYKERLELTFRYLEVPTTLIRVFTRLVKLYKTPYTPHGAVHVP